MSSSMNVAVPIHPTQLEVYPGQDPRRWTRNPSPPEITPHDFERIFPGIDTVSVSTDLLPKHIRGDTNPGNLNTLLKVAKWLNPTTILEIGTFRGRTALGFSQNTLAKKIITVDLPLGAVTSGPSYGPDAEYLRTSDRPVLFDSTVTRISQVFADCTNQTDLSSTIEKALDGSSIDLAYIDAAHTFEGVIVPFTTILPKMAPNGIIAFDDYMKPAFAAVTEAISYLARERGFVFYSVAHPNPVDHGTTSTVFFINHPSCMNRDWKNEPLLKKQDETR
jgi:predicted O-methyltransferase YrrM